MELVTLRKMMEKENYIFDEDLLVTLFVALKLNKPILVEGAAGVGKTEIAKVLSAALEAELIRLQCYEGLDESKSLYEWNYQKQLLYIQMSKDTTLSGLFSEEFLLPRPLLKAILNEKRSVLLIDEVDKTDEEFEAFLLELLSDFQVSIPELGTIKSKSIPVVILTSNNNRQLSDALKRRCVYLYIDYPDIGKEIRIINARLPGIPERLASDIATAVNCLRKDERIYKKPSIAETLDWVTALMALGKSRLDAEGAQKTLGFILKNRDDIAGLLKDGGLDELVNKKPC